MDQAVQTMLDNLQKNTGKSLEEWKQVVLTSGLQKHNDIIKFLKTEHGFTHGFANMVALKFRGTDAGSAESSEQLVEKQYQGKENLLPLYEKLVAELKKFGQDVVLAPKNAYVSVRSKKQFALLQPSTKTRLDVGINLKGIEPEGKLEKSGSFNSMCTHRVRLETMDDITPELLSWLRAAFEQAR
ncbi:phosphoribosylformylglycinamidine synthase [Pontibacter sp. HJ8]